jgi:flavodoxin
VKTAIVYYSFEGNCAMVAGKLKELLNADALELKTADTKKRKGLAKYVWGGSQVFSHKKPELQPFTFDPAAYDLIILGAPVWAGSPAPAMVSFLDTAKISGKKIALFLCHGGGGKKVLGKFKALVPGNDVIAQIDFNNPSKVNQGEFIPTLNNWVKALA